MRRKPLIDLRPAFQKALKPTEMLLDLHPEFTHIELVCMYNYTDHDFMYLNPLLRVSIENRFIREYKKQMSSALNRLPNYEGTCFRGIATDKSLDFVVGDKFIANEFYSSSIKPEESYIYMTKQNKNFMYFFRITSKSGKYIDEISAAGSSFGNKEREVLFNSGTPFIIKGVKHVLDYIVIDIEEL